MGIVELQEAFPLRVSNNGVLSDGEGRAARLMRDGMKPTTSCGRFLRTRISPLEQVGLKPAQFKRWSRRSIRSVCATRFYLMLPILNFPLAISTVSWRYPKKLRNLAPVS